VPRLGDGVQLAQAAELLLVRHRIELLPMHVAHVLHVAQPVVDEPELRTLERGLHAAAAVVAADDDVRHPQHVHGILQHRQAVQVAMDDDVGDVAVDEELARQQADNLVRRHARVAAADP
jgi:hypothetical protein